MNVDEAYDLIYTVVRSIPRGRVATYGQVAELAGLPRRARLVGRALREMPDDTGVPWHRVVNARGGISERGSSSSLHAQRALLRAEGVAFSRGGFVRMDEFQWDP